MIDPVTTMGTSAIGLVSGFVFRLIGEASKASANRQELALKALAKMDDSADRAAERPNAGWLRRFFGVAIVLAVIVVPIIVGFTSKNLLYPSESGGFSLLWGLWEVGGKVVWKEISGYPYIPEVLQAFNLYVFFVVGQKPAKQ